MNTNRRPENAPDDGFTPVFRGHRVEQKSQAALSANAAMPLTGRAATTFDDAERQNLSCQPLREVCNPSASNPDKIGSSDLENSVRAPAAAEGYLETEHFAVE